MTPLTLQLAFTPWTLATEDGEIRVTARETCIREQCVETGTPSLTYGVWRVHDLRIRWTFNDQAIVREGSGPWRPARLSAPTPGIHPPTSLSLAPIDAGDWAPGLWRETTVACDRGRPAWVFESIVRDGTEVVAIPGSAGSWTLRPDASMHRCQDEEGSFSGIRGHASSTSARGKLPLRTDTGPSVEETPP